MKIYNGTLFSNLFFRLFSKPKRIIGYFILTVVALVLGFSAVWFSFLSGPTDPLLHSKTGFPTIMFSVGKVNIIDNEGKPADGASVVLNNEQQTQTDQQGVAYFNDVMFHDHTLDILYKGEHYSEPMHVHSSQNFVTLSWSIEFRRNIGLSSWALFLGWLFFAFICLNKVGQSSIYNLDKLANHPTLKPKKFLRGSKQFVLLNLVVISIIIISIFIPSLSEAVKASSDTNSSLPVPSNINIEQDDNNAVLTWGDPIQPDRPNPTGVTGYRITWGLVGSSNASTVQLTTERAIQLQPLTNGQNYQAKIQSVDSFGNLSNPSQPVTFTGNPARVSALRQRMTGFFDDFDTTAGTFDELKWNQAFSACDNPAMTASFINAQFHAHDMELSTCDRAQVINRPRATFDFTGRTGTIAFDMDGQTSRSVWYLDLIDNSIGPIDITSHINEDGTTPGTPGNMLRLRQNDSNLSLQYIDATGSIKTIADTNWNPYAPLDWDGFKTIPNLRRHWELHVSQQKAEITINGKVVLSGTLNLSFSKATVQWNAFSYNTTKRNVPYALVHWDNFGFDGPASQVETHNYRLEGYAGRDMIKATNNVAVERNLTIPDNVNGALTQRLMFTLQMADYSSYGWNNTDKVLINGKTFSVPKPIIASAVQGNGIDYIRPYSVVINVPAGTLQKGTNKLSFVMASSNLLNVHIELDFARIIGAAKLDYTPPSIVYPGQDSQIMPTMSEVGPAVFIQKIGDQYASDSGRYNASKVMTVNGIIPVSFDIDHSLAMSAMGKNPGITKVQVRINKTVVQEWSFSNPVPATSLTYNFDSTKFTNGQYDLDVVAYNPSGAVSIPNYFESFAKSGDYYPIHLKISNGKATPTPAPTSTPTPTQPPKVTAKPTVTPTPLLSGLSGSYFTNKNLGGNPTLQRIDSTINFNWVQGAPNSKIPVDNFSVRWVGQIKANENATYSFCTQSDDGVRLWINNVMLVNNWTNHAVAENCGNITLKQGQLYSLKMEYYESGGSSIAKLLWKTSSMSKQVIPAGQFFQVKS